MTSFKIYCICKQCHPPEGNYSQYEHETATCSGGHPHPLPGFLDLGDGSHLIYNCPSGCPPSTFTENICGECEAMFLRRDSRDPKTSFNRPQNYMMLFGNEDVAKSKRDGQQKEHDAEVKKPSCPICEFTNEDSFVFEQEEIQQRGYTPYPDPSFDERDTAPHGLCTAASCINKYALHDFTFGVPLVLATEDDVDTTVPPVHVAEERCLECGQGEFRIGENGIATCTSCGEEKSGPIFDVQTSGSLGDRYQLLREDYMRALPIEKSRIVEPPYTYVANENPFSARGRFGSELSDEERAHLGDKKHPDEWFSCLYPYLAQLNKRMTSATLAQHIALASFVDKTFARGHVEPVWMYMHRSGIGNDMKRAFQDATDCAVVFNPVIQNNQHVFTPSMASVQTAFRVVKLFMGSLWPFKPGETETKASERIETELIQRAHDGLKSLEKWDLYHRFLTDSLLNKPFDLEGLLPSAPGLVELICVLWSIRHKNEATFEQVRKFIFPDSAVSYWKMCLNEIGCQLITQLDGIHNIMNELTSD